MRYLFSVVISITALTSVFFPHGVYADRGSALEEAQKSANQIIWREADMPNPSPRFATEYISPLLQIAFSVLGVYFLALFVYGGYLWFIARGDSGAVDKAINTMKSAVIGMVIIFSSYALASFVLNFAFRDINQLQ